MAEIRARYEAGDRAGAVAAVSDRMVDAIDVMGDAETVHATMRAYADAGVEVPVLMPLPWGRDRRASAEATFRAAIGAGGPRARRPARMPPAFGPVAGRP